MKSRILVTGSTGFVGRQVVKALATEDVQIRLVVREGKEQQALLFRKDVEIVSTKDLFSESDKWWERQCLDIDTVVHLAWYAEPGKYLESPKNIDCLIGSLSLVKGAMRSGVKRFVGIGTCLEYDLSSGLVSIDTPINPVVPYADAKAALYMSLSHALPMAGVEFAWCRIFYLYGEGEDPRRLVAYLRSKLSQGEPVELTSGEQVRDFLDVARAGQIITNVVLNKQMGVVNICSGIPITVRQLAEQIADDYGGRDLLQFGVRPDNLFDPPVVVGIPNALGR